MNDSNLIPQNKRPKSEQRKIARMGGLARGEQRRQLKRLSECAKFVLGLPINKDQNKRLNDFYHTKGEEYTYAQLAIHNLMKSVLDGNVKAIRMVAELTGDLKPSGNIETIPQLQINVGSVKAADALNMIVGGQTKENTGSENEE